MAAKTGVTVEEYLALNVKDRSEPHFVHGEIVERALPAPLHAEIQVALGILFSVLKQRTPISLMSEMRALVAPDTIRVLDFAVYLGARPQGRYAEQPAYVAIEIVSPDDRYSEILELLEDYRHWGCPHVWLVNPWTRRLYEFTEAGLLQHSTLRLPEFDFEITASSLFEGI